MDPVLFVDSVVEHAYNVYGKGEFHEATAICYRVMANKNAEEWVHAYAYYIIGMCKNALDRHREALVYFSISEIFYMDHLEKGWHPHYFNVLIESSLANLRLGNMQTATAQLDRARAVFDEGSAKYWEKLPRWFEVRCHLLTSQGLREEALETAVELEGLLINQVNEDKPRAASSFLWISFVYALNGDLDSSEFWNDEADFLIDETHDKKERIFYWLNQIFIRRCRGMDTSRPQQKVMDYLSEWPNQDLEYKLKLVCEIECG